MRITSSEVTIPGWVQLFKTHAYIYDGAISVILDSVTYNALSEDTSFK